MRRRVSSSTESESGLGAFKYPNLGYIKIGFYQSAGPNTGAFLTSIRSDLYFRIIELLVAARKDAAMTQAELGKKLGQRQTFISKFELGERRLDVAEFLAVCRAIGIEPLSIIEAAEGSQPKQAE